MSQYERWSLVCGCQQFDPLRLHVPAVVEADVFAVQHTDLVSFSVLSYSSNRRKGNGSPRHRADQPEFPFPARPRVAARRLLAFSAAQGALWSAEYPAHRHDYGSHPGGVSDSSTPTPGAQIQRIDGNVRRETACGQ